MRRLRWVPLAVLVLGAAEFMVLLGLAKLIGVPLAIGALLAFTLLGGLLLRREGLRAWRKLRAQRGGHPGDDVLDGVVGLIAALLLFIPGFLSGLTGLLLLAPPVRKAARNRLRRYAEGKIPSNVAGDVFGPRQVKIQKTSPATKADEVIEGEIVD